MILSSEYYELMNIEEQLEYNLKEMVSDTLFKVKVILTAKQRNKTLEQEMNLL